MGLFSQSNGYNHILIAVDYVTKWVEAIPTRHADHLKAMKMLKDTIFPRFGVPRYPMTDGGSHFKHRDFRKPLNKFGVAHRLVFFRNGVSPASASN
jgi:hypothetical protein